MDGCVLVEMEAMLDEPGNGRSQEEIKTSIYKVPSLISNGNVKAYQPRVVSFGPYHNGEPHLAMMEAHKKHTLSNYIQRSRRTMKETMKDIFDSVKKMAPELMASYDSLPPMCPKNIDKFVKLMILDGCFMLEVLNVYQCEDYYSENDPIFSRHGEFNVMHLIRTDMLTLENQLPMSLLLELKKCILENDDEPDIEDLNADILWFLNNDGQDLSNNPLGECLHVLDLYHESLLLHRDNEHENAGPQSPDQGAAPPMSRSRSPPQCPDQGAPQSPDQGAPQGPDQGQRKKKTSGHNVVRPATELRESGVHFEKSEHKDLTDITFDPKGGVLKLPKFIVDDSTESIFLNLIAFERCHPPASSDITSFVEFMDHIIDDGQDIKLLSSKGIIDNFIGTDKEAADLFNRMSKGSGFAMNDKLLKAYDALIKYSNKHRNKWRATLFHTHFKNPWAIISLIAAIILLSLTAVQTFFTIRS
ncbi:UPF0481 protein At3g47200-like [Diospyros lotus]|uniref:UPF0481 protein At3g47200-like n=1 Tax=Diospyros lotus TaxID=55363 RepID=UPI00224EEE05|nr:UPF0481 protein At3g47200-like [Diospyros lotus]XP_052170178.1 UPF0481 protein At3g47200-like [Diospyros lotus]